MPLNWLVLLTILFLGVYYTERIEPLPNRTAPSERSVAAMRRPILVENTVTVPYSPEQLWRYVADTQRMDRAVGLPKASFTRVERPEGGEIVTGEYRIGKRLVYARWREHPFAWERPRHYSILREYQRGPVTRFHGGADLEAVETT